VSGTFFFRFVILIKLYSFNNRNGICILMIRQTVPTLPVIFVNLAAILP
jgi:hypothetical protein